LTETKNEKRKKKNGNAALKTKDGKRTENWKLETGNWRLETGDWRLETEHLKTKN
jgi:hypothetical protein